MEITDLGQILDLQKWQTLQDALGKATNFAIIMVNYKGIPVTKHSAIQPFCEEMRKDPLFSTYCEKCDARGGLESVRSQQPYIYRCHFDILDMAIPILFEDHYLGALLAGQVKLSDGEENLEQLLQIPVSEKQAVLEKFAKKYQELPKVSLQKVEETAILLKELSQYLVSEAIQKEFLVEMYEEKLWIKPTTPPAATLQKLSQELQLTARKQTFKKSIHQFYVAQNSLLQPAFDALFQNKHHYFSQKEAADKCQLSVSHFAKLFKIETGENFSSFYRSLKIYWGKESLKLENITVSELAEDLGYSDASYFIKVFKKETGMTPYYFRGQYR